jgi:A/G-specific adenine glycosylase
VTPFANALLAWFDRHGRHDLPWQHPRDAYRVWLSEIMLQQTQVATVIPYFQRFVERLPTLRDLAAADEDTVLALWSGLGYYRRARFLHKAAQLCVEQYNSEMPRDFDALMTLPGIGRSTAGAILAQAYGLRFPILDGNVKRVLTRFHGITGHPGEREVEKQLWNVPPITLRPSWTLAPPSACAHVRFAPCVRCAWIALPYAIILRRNYPRRNLARPFQRVARSW